jgi:4-aminobutyrate aminotransferase
MVLKTYQPPEEVAMIIVEPIQGEGGYIVPPKGYFREVKNICDEYGILFAVDEIQSGMGRTGKWFAIEHFDVIPDIVCIAKGIAAGLPLGIMVSNADIQDWTSGSHASTFGGNPVSCSAAMAVLEVIEEGNLLENAKIEGDYFLKRLEEMKEEHPLIGDVRGKGLMIGVELVKDRESQEYAKEETNKVMVGCFKRGVALAKCGLSVIRMMPPLTITRPLIERSLDIFEESLTEIERRHQ